ncbi:MAG: hypothetical protein Q7T97_00235 [Burkholderiaceae bacterium]|nr:hypothetical protein [Burkholderiaceae bacterium]
MNHSLLAAALFITVGLTACDKPTVVNVPPPAVGVPGPAGPQGATGATGTPGTEGNQGAPGAIGENTTVIVVPPAASAPAN